MLKASVGDEIFDEEWQPIVRKDANSTDNVAERVTMCRPDAIEHIASLFCEQTQIEVGTLKLEVIGMLRRSRYASYSLSFVAKHLSFSGPFKL